MKSIQFLVALFFVVCFYSCESADLRAVLGETLIYKSLAQNKTAELLKENRTDEANAIEVFNNRMNALFEKVLLAPENQVSQLQHDLQYALTILATALMRVNLRNNFQHLKNETIKTGEQELLKTTQLLIILLQHNLTKEAQIIIDDTEFLNNSLAKARVAEHVIDILDAESNVKFIANTRILSDMSRLGLINFSETGDYSDILVDRAANLANQVTQIINKIKTYLFDERYSNDTIVGLQEYSKKINELSSRLKATTDKTTIDALRLNLTEAESRLEAKLAVLKVDVIDTQTNELLLNKINDLSTYVVSESQRLCALNKTAESEELMRQNKLLLDLDHSVRNADTEDYFIDYYIAYKLLVIKDSVEDLLEQYTV